MSNGTRTPLTPTVTCTEKSEVGRGERECALGYGSGKLERVGGGLLILHIY